MNGQQPMDRVPVAQCCLHAWAASTQVSKVSNQVRIAELQPYMQVDSPPIFHQTQPQLHLGDLSETEERQGIMRVLVFDKCGCSAVRKWN